MTVARCVAALGFLLVAVSSAQAQTWISRATFAHGKVWLLEESGRLSTIVKDHRRAVVRLDQPALDLVRNQGDPVIVTCETSTCKNWLVKRHTKGGWKTEAKIPDADDYFIAITGGERMVMVTNRRVIDLTSSVTNGVSYVLPKYLADPPMRVTSALAIGQDVWVGRDAGEWGGSLQHISMKTGHSSDVRPPFNKEGPFVSNVNALLQSPWNPRCILVGQGLVHLSSSSGEILQVCDGKVTTFYRSALGRDTVGFYGLSARDKMIWAAGLDGIYRINADGTSRRTPYPLLSLSNGILLSFNLPRAVLIATDVHRRTSMNRGAPLLVLLDDR